MAGNKKPHGQIRWHYTTGKNLREILDTGEIRPATTRVPKSEKVGVWFSTNQEWENTADKLWIDERGCLHCLNRQQTLEKGGGLARIGVAPEAAPHDWNDHKRLSGITAQKVRHLYKAAIRRGARPGQWFVSYDPVPRSQWLAVEVRDNGSWTPFAGAWRNENDRHGEVTERNLDGTQGEKKMDSKKNIIPLEALFDEGTGPNLSDDPRHSLRDAEVIIGIDIMTEHEFVVFGRQTLEEIVVTGKTRRVRTIYIGLDQDTSELEKLIALIQVVKGHHDYDGGEVE